MWFMRLIKIKLITDYFVVPSHNRMHTFQCVNVWRSSFTNHAYLCLVVCLACHFHLVNWRVDMYEITLNFVSTFVVFFVSKVKYICVHMVCKYFAYLNQWWDRDGSATNYGIYVNVLLNVYLVVIDQNRFYIQIIANNSIWSCRSTIFNLWFNRMIAIW